MIVLYSILAGVPVTRSYVTLLEESSRMRTSPLFRIVSPASKDKSILSPCSISNTARGVPASISGTTPATRTSFFSREFIHKIPPNNKGNITAATQRHAATRLRFRPSPRYCLTTRHIFSRSATSSSFFRIPTSFSTRLPPVKSSSFHILSHSASPGLTLPSSIARNQSFSSFVLILSRFFNVKPSHPTFYT